MKLPRLGGLFTVTAITAWMIALPGVPCRAEGAGETTPSKAAATPGTTSRAAAASAPTSKDPTPPVVSSPDAARPTTPDAPAGDGARPIDVGPADRALLDRLIRDGRVQTRDSAPFAEYGARIRDAVVESLGLSLERLGVVGPALRLIPLIVMIAVVVILAVLVCALWSSKQLPSLPPLSSPAVPLDEDSVTNLRAEAERLLAQGALREALAVLWRWLAAELAGRGLGQTGPEVTRREFVRSVRRMRPGWDRLPELAALARTADVLAYGSTRVTDARVRALVPAAESLLR